MSGEAFDMLIQFNFKNYKSFRDESTLDLSATKISEHSNRVVTIGREKILSAAVIYGANAGGKTNVYEAFAFMHYYVEKSFGFGGDGVGKEEHGVPLPFFLDDESINSDSSFEVYFTDNKDHSNKIYNYGFCVNDQYVSEEWLNEKAKTSFEYKRVFYRSQEGPDSPIELDLKGLQPKIRENIEMALEKEALILSLGAKLKIKKLKEIWEWFNRNCFADFGSHNTEQQYSRTMPFGFEHDQAIREDVSRFISSFEPQFGGFSVEKSEVKGENGGYKVYSLRKNINSENLEFCAMPFQLESAGTLKMFSLYDDMRNALKNGSVFCVDELNAKLHPLLVRLIIQAFLDPSQNQNRAQIIFTTHDSWQLNTGLFRRDEIWFTEKDENGISHLYSLSDFISDDGTKIRNDENYAKNYLLGKYGAIPKLTNIDFLAGE